MSKKKQETKKKLDEDEVEKIFETTWNNWSSRRNCEQTHVPKYIKSQKKEKKGN